MGDGIASSQEVSKGTTAVVITSITCITGISSLLAGLVVVASIYALTCGCTLLLGAVADVIGSRIMYLIECVLQSAFTMACGLSRNGSQLILFRAFASMGSGQQIGFSLGLTLGVLSDSIGWRWGFHIAAIINTAIFGMAVYSLPKNIDSQEPVTLKRLTSDIDWIGAILASASLAMLSYAFAPTTGSSSSIKTPTTIVLLVASVMLVPVFILWVARQERLNRPAIIPNSLWQNKVSTSICISVFLTWGAFNAVENILTLYFQYVQEISAIQTSIRFLPAPISGTLANVVMGLIAHHVRADSALILYWSYEFLAVLFNPVGADTFFTISNLLITSVFPTKTQVLAGGVFNTIAQIGKSVGLATSAVIANSVTAHPSFGDKQSPEALLEGYRATFWYCFALSLTTLVVCLLGLGNIGRVGVKQEQISLLNFIPIASFSQEVQFLMSTFCLVTYPPYNQLTEKNHSEASSKFTP
ncbi:MFS general substrate transporter [Glonium stellatum]|uniref:MFS general substrate transporter n=1 Tax=Glonium stellatum TaxID=574774 RepID=A0A8E2F173_9PEZI|nr:MFS general substrate transporter [Glonium stellatum]